MLVFIAIQMSYDKTVKLQQVMNVAIGIKEQTYYKNACTLFSRQIYLDL